MTADADKTSPPGAPKAPTIDPKDLTLKISGGLILTGLASISCTTPRNS
jgi:hypothetical protein